MYTCGVCGEEFDSDRVYSGHMSGHARSISKDEMVAALHDLAEGLGQTPTLDDASGELPASTTTYKDKFGSWNEALEAADLEPRQVKDIPREDLIEELQRLADELGRTPSISEIHEYGKWSREPYESRFGSIRKAQIATGLEPNEFLPGAGERGKTPKEDLLAHLESLAEDLGRTPKAHETYGLEGYSVDAYQRAFGTWNAALDAGGLEPNADPEPVEVECSYCGEKMERIKSRAESHDQHFCDFDCLGSWNEEHNAGENAPNYKGGLHPYYGPSWSVQREKCLEEYGNQCAVCGMSNDEHRNVHGQELHVHHVRPLREFRDDDGNVNFDIANRPENLVPLCNSHHKEWEGLPLRPAAN